MPKKLIISAFLILAILVNAAFAQNKQNDIEQLNAKILELQKQIIEMQKKHDVEINALRHQVNELAGQTGKQKASDELTALRQLAKAKATEEIITEKQPEEVTFKSGGLSLQTLNPEISFAGDFLFSSRQDSTSEESSNFDFRVLDIHVESWLDPYTRFKAAIPVTESEAKLGEGYITLYDISNDLNLTIGKFRQQFGVVNRWHKHALDQVDFPLALRKIFGNGGLNQSGMSLDWLMPPAGGASQQLTFQVTDGSNSRLFGENTSNRPSLLAHYYTG